MSHRITQLWLQHVICNHGWPLPEPLVHNFCNYSAFPILIDKFFYQYLQSIYYCFYRYKKNTTVAQETREVARFYGSRCMCTLRQHLLNVCASDLVSSQHMTLKQAIKACCQHVWFNSFDDVWCDLFYCYFSFLPFFAMLHDVTEVAVVLFTVSKSKF